MTEKRKISILDVKPGDETLWAIAETERQFPLGRKRPFLLILLLLILVYLVFAHLFVAYKDIFIIGFSPLSEPWKNGWHLFQAFLAGGSLTAFIIKWEKAWLAMVCVSLQQFLFLLINHIYLLSNVDRLRNFFFSNPPSALKMMNFSEFTGQVYMGLSLNFVATVVVIIALFRLKTKLRA